MKTNFAPKLKMGYHAPDFKKSLAASTRKRGIRMKNMNPRMSTGSMPRMRINIGLHPKMA